MQRSGWPTVLWILSAGLAGAAPPPPNPSDVFENTVRPVLAAQCLACHGTTRQSGGVRLDRPLTPRQAQRLVAAVRYDGPVRMPPTGPLPERERDALIGWAQHGAPFPKHIAPASRGATAQWPYTPVKPGLAPPVDGARTDIDAFLRAKLLARGLDFAPPADRRTRIRRVTFDLTGLPPTPDQVAAFVNDTHPDAYAQLVDRLLASPAYGERWGRHWLDVARYADSADARGLGGEGDISEAWRYRDWVIAAFNADLPYDRFIRRQLAGDLQNDPIPTGFLAIGNWGNGDADKDKILTDIADDQVDTTSKAFLGLTVGCARCHDHKFDPISTRDYYALAGIFFSSHILPRLTPKGQGEILLRIPLETPAQKGVRETLARIDRERSEERTAGRNAVAAAAIEEAHQGRVPDENRWREFLDDSPTLRTPFQHLGDVAGVDGVRGTKDALSATINTTALAQRILTFILPPRSVSLHPSPHAGIAVTWTASRDATVALAATLADADPACGDGVVWELRHGDAVVASGRIANGGSAEPLRREVTVRAGERLLLCVLPGADYSCDTTTVTWTVDGQDLTTDALAHPGSGSFGPWRFVDLDPVARSAEVEAVRAAWQAGETARALALAAALPPDQSPFFVDTDAVLPIALQTRLAALERDRAALQSQLPAVPESANGIAEGGVPGSPQEGVHDVAIHRRGRYDQLGERVPRGAPVALGGGPFSIRTGSGRRELAAWIASPKNPLTARVLVNRVWQGHFGRGIVGTPSNFGFLGERPTHPELLDFLAARFLADGGSLKRLHRLIVTSDAYQQSSVPTARSLARDPDNRLLSRAPRRRLEAEALRDSILAVAGTLDRTPGGIAFRDLATPRRTVYAMTIRSDRTGFGPLFDSPDTTSSAEKRNETTVASQALYLLNSPFIREQAHALARRLQALPGPDAARIGAAYRRLYARPPTPGEIALGQAFLQHLGPDGWDAYAQALLCANEFCYVD
jgi:cytochrome c553